MRTCHFSCGLNNGALGTKSICHDLSRLLNESASNKRTISIKGICPLSRSIHGEIQLHTNDLQQIILINLRINIRLLRAEGRTSRTPAEAAALMGESPRASQSSRLTSSVTLAP